MLIRYRCFIRISARRKIVKQQVRERGVFYNSCDLTGTESGQYSPVRPAHSTWYPIRCVLSRLERLAAFIRKCFGHDIKPINSLSILSSLSLSLLLSLTLTTITLDSFKNCFEMNFVLANYELLNELSEGLKTVCDLMIRHKKQIRKSKNVRYLFTITINSIYFLKSPKQLVRFKTLSNDMSSTICHKFTFVECLQVCWIMDIAIVSFTAEPREFNGMSKRSVKSPCVWFKFLMLLQFFGERKTRFAHAIMAKKRTDSQIQNIHLNLLTLTFFVT